MIKAMDFPVPSAAVPEPVDKFRREQWAFYRLLGELLKTHKGQYVAVHNEQVIESGADMMEVITRAYQKVGNVPLFVERVSDEPPPVYRMPRLRVSRPQRSA